MIARNISVPSIHFTSQGVIYAYDYDVTTASISNRRDVVTFDRATEGFPDGHTIDTNGNLWVALNQGGSIVQIDPKTGKLVVQPTSQNVL